MSNTEDTDNGGIDLASKARNVGSGARADRSSDLDGDVNQAEAKVKKPADDVTGASTDT